MEDNNFNNYNNYMSGDLTFNLTVPKTWRIGLSTVRIPAYANNALREALVTRKVDINLIRIFKTLYKNRFCDINGNLTTQGEYNALLLCTLNAQCKYFNIPMKVLEPSGKEKPEFKVMNHYRGMGEKVSCCEGGSIRTALYCLCLRRLYNCGIKHWHGNESIVKSFMYMSMISYGYFIEDDPTLPEKLIQDISIATESDLVAGYDMLQSWQGGPDGYWPFRKWIGVNKDFICQLYRLIGNETFVKIARLFFTDPYAFCKGWPDLVAINSSTLRLIEVKTTDKLHLSQLIVIPELLKSAGLDVEVLKVKRLLLSNKCE